MAAVICGLFMGFAAAVVVCRMRSAGFQGVIKVTEIKGRLGF